MENEKHGVSDEAWMEFCREIGLNRDLLRQVSDQASPVPLDEEKIRAFHRGELSGPEEYAVAELIAKCAEWRDADARITEQEFGELGKAQRGDVQQLLEDDS